MLKNLFLKLFWKNFPKSEVGNAGTVKNGACFVFPLSENPFETLGLTKAINDYMIVPVRAFTKSKNYVSN